MRQRWDGDWTLALLVLGLSGLVGCDHPCDVSAANLATKLESPDGPYGYRMTCWVDEAGKVHQSVIQGPSCMPFSNFLLPVCFAPGQQPLDACVPGKSFDFPALMSAPVLNYYCLDRLTRYLNPGMEGCSPMDSTTGTINEATYLAIGQNLKPSSEEPATEDVFGAGCVAKMLAHGYPGKFFSVRDSGKGYFVIDEGECDVPGDQSPFQPDSSVVANYANCENGQFDPVSGYTGTCGKTVAEVCGTGGISNPACLELAQGKVAVPIVGRFKPPASKEVLCLLPLPQAPDPPTETPILTALPTKKISINQIRPLGHTDPPDHTLPVNHLYFDIAEWSTPEAEVFAPAKSRLTMLQKCLVPVSSNESDCATHCSAVKTSDCKSALLALWPFSDYYLTLDHIQQLDPAIQVDDPGNVASSCSFGDCTTDSETTAGTNWCKCDIFLQQNLVAGAKLGTAGNPSLPYSNQSFDFGVHDLRPSATANYGKYASLANSPAVTQLDCPNILGNSLLTNEIKSYLCGFFPSTPAMSSVVEKVAGLRTAVCPLDGYLTGSGQDPTGFRDLLAKKLVKDPNVSLSTGGQAFSLSPLAAGPTKTWQASGKYWLPNNHPDQEPWPRCGVVLQDDPNSIHGMWFLVGASPLDEKNALAFLDVFTHVENGEGMRELVSLGGGSSLLGAQVVQFLPLSTSPDGAASQINPVLVDVKFTPKEAGSPQTVYCAEAEDAALKKSMLFQLQSINLLRLEFREKTCLAGGFDFIGNTYFTR